MSGEKSTWFADLPERWTSRRLKYLTSCNDEVLSETTPDDLEIQYVDIGSVSGLGVIEKTEAMPFGSAPSRARRVVRSGDILVSTVRTYLKAIAAVKEAPSNLIASTGFAVIRCADGAIPGYMAYALRTEGFVGEVISRSVGVSYPAINSSDLVGLSVPAPPLAEQTQIAKFLDYETAKIDALIDKQQQLIALLKEKRQAVISHAVTKGLDPDALMKDSGVEWLGEVPAHWRSGKLKFFADLRSGHTPSRSKPEYWENCYIPWFSLADVWQLRDGRQLYLGETKETISDIGLANSAADLLPEGTVILSRTASVGFSGIMPREMATTQDFVNWIPGPLLKSEFLLFVFRGMVAEFERMKMGSTHKTIYMPDVRQFSCAVPPLEEQQEIVDHILERLELFDRTIEQSEETVDLLQERRTALISAAVTGKIDVRNWQPPAADPETA